MSSAHPNRIVGLPRSALTLLSHRCSSAGPSGVRALREAGYRAGADLFADLGDRPDELSLDDFWPAFDRLVTDLGLGSLAFDTAAPAVGAVSWQGSPEAGGTRLEAGTPRCHFAAGLLGGMLSRAAGRTVAVLEARCGSGGSEPCWFLFGGVDRLREIRRRSTADPSLESVLAP